MLPSAATTVHADELELRLRGIYLAPANASTAYGPLQIPGNAIHVNDKWLPAPHGEPLQGGHTFR
jgi:hypothetical protein